MRLLLVWLIHCIFISLCGMSGAIVCDCCLRTFKIIQATYSLPLLYTDRIVSQFFIPLLITAQLTRPKILYTIVTCQFIVTKWCPRVTPLEVLVRHPYFHWNHAGFKPDKHNKSDNNNNLNLTQ